MFAANFVSSFYDIEIHQSQTLTFSLSKILMRTYSATIPLADMDILKVAIENELKLNIAHSCYDKA